MTTLANNTTTTLFTNASNVGFTPIRGLKGVCARINCGADNCTEKAFIFRNNTGKVINACVCGWRRIAPPTKKWGKTITKTPHINEELEVAFAAKKTAAMMAAGLVKEQAEFKPDMS